MNMHLRGPIWIFVLAFLSITVSAQDVKPGEIHASVTVQQDPAYSYALYLPSNYTPRKRWPILLAFDPFGRGVSPVKLFQEGAEKYGFIVVGSNNSRNFSDPSKAIRLTWDDVIYKFSIDPRGFYTTGLSGGARVASSIAIACKTCVAGVIACAAGLPQNTKTLPETTEWFLATGTVDFNYPEMLQLHENLDKHHLVNRLDVFDGPHGWMPAAMADEALAWLRLRAMIKGTVPVDKDFIEAEFKKRIDGAQASLEKGDVLSAWRAYQDIVNDFGKLRDVSATEKALQQLNSSKELQKARKNEKAAIDLQKLVEEKLNAALRDSSAGADDKDLSTRSGDHDELGQLQSAANEQQRALRKEKDPSSRDGLTRGLWSAFVSSMESGQQALLAKDYSTAKRMFEAATIIMPEVAWPHSALASAYAVTGDKKQALSELRKAVDNGFSNPETFSDKDFDRLRDDPAFKDLVARVNANAQKKP
jgi:tetratricopeptide (TPR) repeat protein